MLASAGESKKEPGQHETLDRMAEAQNYNAWLLERARPYLGQRILDVGAGIGTFAEALARERELVVAVEPEAHFGEMLQCRFAETPNVYVVPGDATEVERYAPVSTFDSIICFNVFEHIPDDYGAAATLRDRLEPGGRLLALVPAHPTLFGSLDEMLDHERRYTKASLGGMLTSAGLTVEHLRYVNPLGAFAWLLSSRILKRQRIPAHPLRAYDRFVPLLRRLDELRLPFGLSVWAVARR